MLEVGPEDTQVIRYLAKYLCKQSSKDVYAEFFHCHGIQKELAIKCYTKGLQISPTTSEGRHCMKVCQLFITL
ncbi:hypothetical protein EXN66_Car019666 [Channa argus]|uniref:Uncharacterized protein n=1 Tax=Channa argus TaxID=215402 RepID=A0A6G1QP25_CHAAH|nr:hypothetical protein EXN66_Car019666 [Channa argus]